MRGHSISMSNIRGFNQPVKKDEFVRTAEVEIAVPSMMHSGTHLLRFDILKGFYKGEPEGKHFFNGSSGRVMNVFHLNHDQFPQKLIDMMDQLPVFTCLRHPSRIWESYKKRQTKDQYNYRWNKYELQWRRLIDIVSKRDPLYVHVDAPEVRDEQVKRMGEALDLPLECDWKINARSGSVYGTHNYDTYEKDIPKEFIDFYYETMNNNRA
jgi:hypothetical protein